MDSFGIENGIPDYTTISLPAIATRPTRISLHLPNADHWSRGRSVIHNPNNAARVRPTGGHVPARAGLVGRLRNCCGCGGGYSTTRGEALHVDTFSWKPMVRKRMRSNSTTELAELYLCGSDARDLQWTFHVHISSSSPSSLTQTSTSILALQLWQQSG